VIKHLYKLLSQDVFKKTNILINIIKK